MKNVHRYANWPADWGTVQELVLTMRNIAIRALRRMYRPEANLFAFHIRRARDGNVIEGISRRYTAIVLLGLKNESPDVVCDILGGRCISVVQTNLIDGLVRTQELGEVALVLWALRADPHPRVAEAINRLRAMDPAKGHYSTVELAWSLMALVAEGDVVTDELLARLIARRLMNSFNPDAGLFSHWPDSRQASRFRFHVACFADQVYPILALANYYRVHKDSAAIMIASRCAEQICRLQGLSGQWWWHYDGRTGNVVEGYPVYSVHQDAMAPMALHALHDANGMDYRRWINNGVSWMAMAPETGFSLIDLPADLIWRKVARHEPNRLTRGLQAFASRLHPSLRVPGLNMIFKPGAVDYECRPYHMGWILYAWPISRLMNSDVPICHETEKNVQPSESGVLTG